MSLAVSSLPFTPSGCVARISLDRCRCTQGVVLAHTKLSRCVGAAVLTLVSGFVAAASIGLTQIEAEGLPAKVGTETRAQGWRVS
jgi:hypothetical protein